MRLEMKGGCKRDKREGESAGGKLIMQGNDAETELVPEGDSAGERTGDG